VSYGNVSPEGDKSEVSWGSLYLPGGFFIWGGDLMSAESFKRKLTAILSADVKGYSRLMGEDEAETVKTLTTYRKIMGELIQQHRGRVIDSPGDNILAEFASVVDAVQCSVAAQNEFKARNAELPEDRRMEFRIGVNLGDVIEEEGRIYGDGVNIAARLEALANPGGICISKTAFDHIETKLPLGYEYLGEQTVKNIAKPVGAYRVLMEPRVTVAGAKAKAPKVPLWRHKNVLASAVVALVAIIGVGVWNFYWRAPKIEPASKEKMAFPLPDKPSIAVLPFDNMSANPEYDSLADSLSENIIYTLSYLPGMFVVARNSTFSYKGKPVEIRQVAEQLGVRYVLEGSVLRAGDRVRVTAQLIDATTGYHLWSGRFDRSVNDIFSLLDEIAKTIAGELQVKVSPDQWASLAHKTDNFDAWAATTRAYSLLTRGFRENAVEVKRLSEKGVALDPKYGFGWGVLAAVHTLEVIYGLTQSPAESIKLAAECNEKALTLDPTLSCSTANRGQIYLLQGKVEEATAFCRKAIDMAPSLDTNYLIFGVTMDFAGNFDEAIPLFKKAMRLNPFYPAGYLRYYGMACLMADRKEEALSAFKEYLERAQRGESPPLSAHLGLCAVYAELGKEEEARSHVVEILKINPTFSMEEAKKAYRWRDPEYSERWLSSLRKAGLPG
jgi:adenylate cyclase